MGIVLLFFALLVGLSEAYPFDSVKNCSVWIPAGHVVRDKIWAAIHESQNPPDCKRKKLVSFFPEPRGWSNHLYNFVSLLMWHFLHDEVVQHPYIRLPHGCLGHTDWVLCQLCCTNGQGCVVGQKGS